MDPTPHHHVCHGAQAAIFINAEHHGGHDVADQDLGSFFHPENRNFLFRKIVGQVVDIAVVGVHLGFPRFESVLAHDVSQ